METRYRATIVFTAIELRGFSLWGSGILLFFIFSRIHYHCRINFKSNMFTPSCLMDANLAYFDYHPWTPTLDVVAHPPITPPRLPPHSVFTVMVVV